MEKCSENAFCRELPENIRKDFCSQCVKTTFAAGSEVDFNFQTEYLVLTGCMMHKQNDSLLCIAYPGDITIPMNYIVDPGVKKSFMGKEYQAILSESYMQFIADTSCACFQKEFLDYMSNDITFARALYYNKYNFISKTHLYHLYVFQSSAYDSVRYILKLCKNAGIGKLTQAQIAELTRRNRCTVTKAIHEIASKEPELLE